ncbi:MAG: hypothetical protein RSG52_07345 [Terrisporobacter sp.]|uniref:hypothetical protein n=1 Tax=Terrisporobacter sp. TaxID=1965305 RepID=UPI002FC6B13B
MEQYGISRYEEFIKKYNKTVNYNNLEVKKDVCILDETGLELDRTLKFDILNRCKIIHIEYSSFDKIEITLDCDKSHCNTRYIKLVFEDIMYCNGDFIYSGNIDFIYLKEGFRFEIKENKKSKKMKDVSYYEVES